MITELIDGRLFVPTTPEISYPKLVQITGFVWQLALRVQAIHCLHGFMHIVPGREFVIILSPIQYSFYNLLIDFEALTNGETENHSEGIKLNSVILKPFIGENHVRGSDHAHVSETRFPCGFCVAYRLDGAG